MKKIYNYTGEDVREYAKKISQTVVIRSYKDGNSNDIRRESTNEERSLVERAIAAALLAIKGGYDASGAKATAEFFIIYNSREVHINTYDSVYIPIDDFLKEQEA